MKKFIALAFSFFLSANSFAGMREFGGSLLPYPFFTNYNISGSSPSNNTDTLDSTADKLAIVFMAPKTGNMRTIYVPFGTITGASGNVTIDVRIETVDATSGNPTGTLWGTNTNGTLTANFNDDNTYKSLTLTADAAVVKNDKIAIVLNPLVFTTVTSALVSRFSDINPQTSYGTSDLTGGGYAKTNAMANLIIQYDDGSYVHIPGSFPSDTITTTAFNSGSSPAIRGFSFTAKFTAKVGGCWMWMLTAAGADFNAKLYDSDGVTVLATGTFDANIMQAATTAGIWQLLFSTDAMIFHGKKYYVSIEPTTATNVTVYTADMPNSSAGNAYPGGGDFATQATKSGSTWTETNTSRAFGGILISQLSDNNSGGFGTTQ